MRRPYSDDVSEARRGHPRSLALDLEVVPGGDDGVARVPLAQQRLLLPGVGRDLPSHPDRFVEHGEPDCGALPLAEAARPDLPQDQGSEPRQDREATRGCRGEKETGEHPHPQWRRLLVDVCLTVVAGPRAQLAVVALAEVLRDLDGVEPSSCRGRPGAECTSPSVVVTGSGPGPVNTSSGPSSVAQATRTMNRHRRGDGQHGAQARRPLPERTHGATLGDGVAPCEEALRAAVVSRPAGSGRPG